MTSDETSRISTLTTGAIKTTTDNTVKAMIAAVEAAEAKTQEMRAAMEEYVAEFEQKTEALAEHVSTHIASCQAAIDSFQAHHLKILNVDPKPEAPAAVELPRPRLAAPVNLDDELGKLRAIVPSAADGKR